jgi:hypothetical protein
MICDRYWRDGIVLVERGLDDPHRIGCIDCTRAHESRRELVEALPLIGAGDTGDPHWQAKVWRRIDGERAHAPWRWRWQLASGLAVACVVALWIGLGRHADVRPRLPDVAIQPSAVVPKSIPPHEIVPGSLATMRSGSRSGSADEAYVYDRLRVTAGEASDVWVYRAGRLEMQCRAGQRSDGCTPTAHGMIVELVLSMPELYQVIVVDARVALPSGSLDEDRAALETAGAHYQELPVRVR